ncbi:hypothetical protein EB093_06315 [bacterium]|nr:hypothetical protein [bacterium]
MIRWVGLGLLLGVSPILAADRVSPALMAEIKRLSSDIAQLAGEFNRESTVVVPSRPVAVPTINRSTYGYKLVRKVGDFGSIRYHFNGPAGVAVDARSILVADRGNGRVIKLDHSLTQWDEIRIRDEADYALDSPTGVAVAGSTIWVADTHNNRLVRFGYDGNYGSQLGKLGIGSGEFDSPVAVLQTRRNELFVVDQRNHRVQRLAVDGSFIAEFGAMGGDNQLRRPVDIDIVQDTWLVVADAGANAIVMVDLDGRWIRTITGPMGSVAGVGVDEQGMIYCADTVNNTVWIFAIDGRCVGQWDTPSPTDVAIWGDLLIVSDSIHNAIRTYRRTPL